jgi:hypothetical protein
MKLAGRVVGTRNEEPFNHNRDKAAEIIRKHNLPLLGDFLLVYGQILAIFRAVL